MENLSDSYRIYRYQFHNKWYDRFRLLKHGYRSCFKTSHGSISDTYENPESVLANPDFLVNQMNVVEWARENIHYGKMILEFEISISTAGLLLNPSQKKHFELVAKFSDVRHALMYKMAFGYS